MFYVFNKLVIITKLMYKYTYKHYNIINIYIDINIFQFKMWWVFIACILYLDAGFCVEPVVEINDGAVRGQILKSRDGRDYYSFTGIPYAKPPVDQLRFKVKNIIIF